MSDYNNNAAYTRGNTTTYTTQPNAAAPPMSGLNLTLLGSGVVVAMVLGALYYLSAPIKDRESNNNNKQS